MTREDIIRMAREAGLEILVVDGEEEVGCGDRYHIQTDLIECLIQIATAAEREACAKVCERDDSMRWSGAADAIRARSNT